MNIPELPASKQQPVRIQGEVTDSQLLTGHLGTVEVLPSCQRGYPHTIGLCIHTKSVVSKEWSTSTAQMVHVEIWA
jgi:hypothetical protein